MEVHSQLSRDKDEPAEGFSLTPIFIVFLSSHFLKEQVTWQRWLFLAASFTGVLLVVRPGFRELSLGHLAAWRRQAGQLPQRLQGIQQGQAHRPQGQGQPEGQQQ